MRFLGEPVYDWIGTIIGAVLLYKIFKIPFELAFVSLILLGMLLHWLFGVPTSTLKYLGLTCSND